MIRCGYTDFVLHNSSRNAFLCRQFIVPNYIVYTQSLSKMLDILCAPLLRLFQEAVARNKQIIEDLTRENNQLLKDLVESDVT